VGVAVGVGVGVGVGEGELAGVDFATSFEYVLSPVPLYATTV
jgi:hypothetical protein